MEVKTLALSSREVNVKSTTGLVVDYLICARKTVYSTLPSGDRYLPPPIMRLIAVISTTHKSNTPSCDASRGSRPQGAARCLATLESLAAELQTVRHNLNGPQCECATLCPRYIIAVAHI